MASRFIIRDVRVEYAGEKEPGEPFRVRYRIVNAGDTTGSCEIRIYDHNGRLVYLDYARDVAPGVTVETTSYEFALPEKPVKWVFEVYNLDTRRVDDRVEFSVGAEKPLVQDVFLPLVLGFTAVAVVTAVIIASETMKQ